MVNMTPPLLLIRTNTYHTCTKTTITIIVMIPVALRVEGAAFSVGKLIYSFVHNQTFFNVACEIL